MCHNNFETIVLWYLYSFLFILPFNFIVEIFTFSFYVTINWSWYPIYIIAGIFVFIYAIIINYKSTNCIILLYWIFFCDQNNKKGYFIKCLYFFYFNSLLKHNRTCNIFMLLVFKLLVLCIFTIRKWRA